jgi:hypothetical protein
VFSEDLMPTISEFYGIVIRMYFMDHAPPHFHAVYGGSEAVIDIRTLEIIEGSLRVERCRSSSNGRRNIAKS